MSKVRNFIILVIIIMALWHLYGETFNQSGLQGVKEDFLTDVDEIRENPIVIETVDTISTGVQLLIGKISENIQDEDEQIQPNIPAPDKPNLQAPSVQSFSIHNIEIGDTKEEVESQVGSANRESLNEYGVMWHAYHENYHNFFMVAYDEHNRVVGLYTNQDLLSTTIDLSFNDTRDTVLSTLGEPLSGIRKGLINYKIQSHNEYDTFSLDDSYVTIFYDKHENNTITAVELISEELEKKKEAFFGIPSPELREGLEYQLFDLTNASRVIHGLPVLNWDESVRNTARNHSIDMAENNYFSHTNPLGQSPFDRMEEDQIVFRTAGENLAAGQSSSIFAHEGLMNSKGHRDNILNPAFEALAVGVAFNEDNQPYYTENFLAK
ncbi:CAP domain-containing protein [Ornithinibacillus halophilus]|uniref:Cysteine-rich secretory protein family protein n=1 Tax=Ornithinibacillus halophilus TaxID=930117 RepID=A0A1M5IL21_9BACI|nr:CAP domain-containing protein [Ornithinibacillus halophilus]SHG28739.1 Cysteine-rich secretory protein family protein [Ornithinibacillus halophilus]